MLRSLLGFRFDDDKDSADTPITSAPLLSFQFDDSFYYLLTTASSLAVLYSFGAVVLSPAWTRITRETRTLVSTPRDSDLG